MKCNNNIGDNMYRRFRSHKCKLKIYISIILIFLCLYILIDYLNNIRLFYNNKEFINYLIEPNKYLSSIKLNKNVKNIFVNNFKYDDKINFNNLKIKNNKEVKIYIYNSIHNYDSFIASLILENNLENISFVDQTNFEDLVLFNEDIKTYFEEIKLKYNPILFIDVRVNNNNKLICSNNLIKYFDCELDSELEPNNLIIEINENNYLIKISDLIKKYIGDLNE